MKTATIQRVFDSSRLLGDSGAESELSEWASIAAIVGAVATLITLVYLGVEVSQNTGAVKASTRQAMID